MPNLKKFTVSVPEMSRSQLLQVQRHKSIFCAVQQASNLLFSKRFNQALSFLSQSSLNVQLLILDTNNVNRNNFYFLTELFLINETCHLHKTLQHTRLECTNGLVVI